MWIRGENRGAISIDLLRTSQFLSRQASSWKTISSILKDLNHSCPCLTRMKKLILSSFQSPGDLVMLTAAVRDLHACYPGGYLTDVRTGSPELWDNNPYLTSLDISDPAVELIECQ